MNLSPEEKDLLIEVIEKHIAFVDSNRRNVAGGSMNNLKKRNEFASKLANLRNIRCKVSMM